MEPANLSRVALRGLDVAQWNLVGVVGLVVACSGPGIAVDTGDEAGSTGSDPVVPDDDGETESEGADEGSETGDPETDECQASWDCPEEQACIEGRCVDDDGADDGYDDGYDDRDNYECFDDEDCGPGGFCEFEGAEVGPGYSWCEGERLIPTCERPAVLFLDTLPQPERVSSSLSFVDIDGDGADDLVSGNYQGAEVLYGPGGGAFEPLPLPEARVVDVAAADFDGDSLRDLATLDEFGRVTLLRGIEGGGWGAATTDTLVSSAIKIEALEWDDSPTDLAVTHSGGPVQVRLSDDAGFFGDVVTLEADELSATVTGPLQNGDTQDEVAMLAPSGHRLDVEGALGGIRGGTTAATGAHARAWRWQTSMGTGSPLW